MPRRKTASPPIEIASSDAPWKRIPHRDRLVAPGGDARELERHADRFRAAGREQHLVQVAGSERRQLSRRGAPRTRW
jgi:hypothetical protein